MYQLPTTGSNRMGPCHEPATSYQCLQTFHYQSLASLSVDAMSSFETAKNLGFDELLAEDFTNHCVEISIKSVQVGDYVVFHKGRYPSMWGTLCGKPAQIGRVARITQNTVFVKKLSNHGYDDRVFQMVPFPQIGCWIYFWDIRRSINLSKEETRILVNNKANFTLHKITSNFTTTYLWDPTISEDVLVDMLKGRA